MRSWRIRRSRRSRQEERRSKTGAADRRSTSTEEHEHRGAERETGGQTAGRRSSQRGSGQEELQLRS